MSGSCCAGGPGLRGTLSAGSQALYLDRHDCEPRPVAEAVPSGAEDSGLWTQADLTVSVFAAKNPELSSV